MVEGIRLGIRLVIILPTFLFLIGFSFKAIIEGRNLERIARKEGYYTLSKKLWLDFFFIVAIDSLFLLIANGLILAFELYKTEIGIIAIIAGVILTMCLLIGIYANSSVGIVGLLGIFGLLAGEFGYFCFYGMDTTIFQIPLEIMLFIVGLPIGALWGITMTYLAMGIRLTAGNASY